jgi:hypothetical protein
MEDWAIACNFVGAFRLFRLERRHGSCNVYQSVKLSVTCQVKAIAESGAKKTNKAPDETLGT